jgi:hypothetical protein
MNSAAMTREFVRITAALRFVEELVVKPKLSGFEITLRREACIAWAPDPQPIDGRK